eukprot:6171852-Pleurochrysis_carterae.AAC.2
MSKKGSESRYAEPPCRLRSRSGASMPHRKAATRRDKRRDSLSKTLTRRALVRARAAFRPTERRSAHESRWLSLRRLRTSLAACSLCFAAGI